MEDNKVAILLEDLRSQFRVFGEGLELLNGKIDSGFTEINNRFDKLETRMDHMESTMSGLETSNHQEHQQLMQMITEVDREVQTEIKQVK